MIFGTALLITSPESLLSQRAVQAREKQALIERPDAEVHRLSAAQLDAGQLAEITGGSLFASATIVAISELGELDAGLHDQLVKIATKPHDDLCLTMVHAGGQKGSGLITKLTKNKVPKEKIDALKPWELASFVTNEAKSLKVKIDLEAAQIIVEAVGADLRLLSAAVNQLAADWQEKSLTTEMVKKYFNGQAEVSSFAICDDVIYGRISEALEKLRWAAQIGQPPVKITSAFASNLRVLGKYLAARGKQLSDNQMAAAIGAPPWRIKKELPKQARIWSPEGIAAAIKAVAVADEEVKGVAVDAQYSLEAMVLAVDKARKL